MSRSNPSPSLALVRWALLASLLAGLPLTADATEASEATLPLEDVLTLYRERDAREQERESPPPIQATLERVEMRGRLLEEAMELEIDVALEVLAEKEWVSLPILKVGPDTHLSALPRLQGGVLSIEKGVLRFLSKKAGRYAFRVSLLQRSQASDEPGEGPAPRRLSVEHGGATLARLRVEYDPGLFRLVDTEHLREPDGALLFATDDRFTVAWESLAPTQELALPVGDAPSAPPAISSAHASSVSTLEGERITRVHYVLSLSGPERIELELPPGERLERAYLNGRALEAGGDRDRHPVFDVAPARAGERAATLELVLMARGLDFHLSGELAFALPKTSWPTRELYLEVFLPEVFNYAWKGGSLAPTDASPQQRFAHEMPTPGKRQRFHQYLISSRAPDVSLSYAVDIEGHYYCPSQASRDRG